MKIAVTGGEGFIGRRLVALLRERGHEIVVIDSRSETNPIDILDLSALMKAFEGCDAIYHLAAEHRDDVQPRDRYYEVNVRGARHMIAAAAANHVRHIVFTSSFAVYGLDRGTPDEQTMPEPFNDYGLSKLEAEAVFHEWVAHHKDVRLTIVRPVVVFGEGNKGNVHTLISQVVSNRFVMIGNGENRKSMAYVGNVAAFLAHCLYDRNPYVIYNYADAPDYSMNALMDVLYKKFNKERPALRLPLVLGLVGGQVFDFAARLTGRKFPISAIRVKKFCADTTCNAQKARETGFVPPYTLEEGLSRMIDTDFLGKTAGIRDLSQTPPLQKAS